MMYLHDPKTKKRMDRRAAKPVGTMKKILNHDVLEDMTDAQFEQWLKDKVLKHLPGVSSVVLSFFQTTSRVEVDVGYSWIRTQVSSAVRSFEIDDGKKLTLLSNHELHPNIMVVTDLLEHAPDAFSMQSQVYLIQRDPTDKPLRKHNMAVCKGADPEVYFIALLSTGLILRCTSHEGIVPCVHCPSRAYLPLGGFCVLGRDHFAVWDQHDECWEWVGAGWKPPTAWAWREIARIRRGRSAYSLSSSGCYLYHDRSIVSMALFSAE